MAQQEILNLLFKTEKPLTSKEISKRVGVNQWTSMTNLRKLKAQRLVITKKIKPQGYKTKINFYKLNKKCL